MTDPFDDLMQKWDKTTNEHVEWQKIKDKLSIEELFRYAIKLLSQEDEFVKFTENLKPSYPSGESTLIAAKYKNLHAIERFLSSVLLELSMRLFNQLKNTKKKPVKDELDPKIKSLIIEQVQIQIAKELKKSKRKHDSKRAQKSL